MESNSDFDAEIDTLGRFEHSIDSKGRTIIPADLRKMLGDSFIITRGLDGCAFIYTLDQWKEFSRKLLNLSLSSRNNRAVQRDFFSKSKKLIPDKQGRVVIPPVIRQFAHLKDTAVFINMFTRVEVWDPDELERFESAESIENAIESINIADLGTLGEGQKKEEDNSKDAEV